MGDRPPDYRRRLEIVLGRNIAGNETQRDILIELLELLEKEHEPTKENDD